MVLHQLTSGVACSARFTHPSKTKSNLLDFFVSHLFCPSLFIFPFSFYIKLYIYIFSPIKSREKFQYEERVPQLALLDGNYKIMISCKLHRTNQRALPCLIPMQKLSSRPLVNVSCTNVLEPHRDRPRGNVSAWKHALT